jgi:hypothetical protein
MWWRQKPRLKFCRFPRSMTGLLMFRSHLYRAEQKSIPKSPHRMADVAAITRTTKTAY